MGNTVRIEDNELKLLQEIKVNKEQLHVLSIVISIKKLIFLDSLNNINVINFILIYIFIINSNV